MSIEGKNNSPVSNLAYQLWEQAGRPSERDLEFWLEAEKQVSSPQRNSTTTLEAAYTRRSSAASQPPASNSGHMVTPHTGHQTVETKHKAKSSRSR